MPTAVPPQKELSPEKGAIMANQRKTTSENTANDETISDARAAFVPVDAIGFTRAAMKLVREFIPRPLGSDVDRRPITIDYDKDFPVALARVIALARSEHGLSQTELAEAVSKFIRTDDEGPVTQSWVSKNEQRANPSLSRVIGLAAALKLTPSALIIAAETDLLLRTHGVEPEEGWDKIIAKLLDSFIRDVRRGGSDFPEKERKIVAAWKSPTVDTVAYVLGSIGGAIRRRRYLDGLTLQNVVDRAEAMQLKADLSKPYLSQIETGAGHPSLLRLGLLAQLLSRSRPRIYGDAADETGESPWAKEVATPVSDLIHEAETIALRGDPNDRTNELQSLKKRFEQCVKLLDRLVEQNENDTVNPDRVVNTLKNAPLVEVMYLNMAAEEPKERRPGRPPKKP